ncbi:hypothetical protein NLI96_g6710 [Meripilus lineatus]|uniref:RING-type domain-containing protein n=1 Tax=Meripilus lineatus TaxID=2056292 RepID=A0AAD5YCQ0_9APHY|nr:hypothetical protein NLI96_g6710 [Physisporinus lineatus]
MDIRTWQSKRSVRRSNMLEWPGAGIGNPDIPGLKYYHHRRSSFCSQRHPQPLRILKTSSRDRGISGSRRIERLSSRTTTMPPPSSSSGSHGFSHRRTTISSRLRENRTQSLIIPPSSGRRDRSPDLYIHTTDDSNIRSDTKKRRGALRLASVSQTNQMRISQNLSVPEESIGDRGRKGKSRHRPTSQVSEDVDMVSTEEPPARIGAKSRKKDRSRSRETAYTYHKAQTPLPSEDEKEDTRSYTGPLAATEYHRMKKEYESMKKSYSIPQENDRLKKELAATIRSNSEHCTHIEKLRTQTKKSDEVINTIESHMNCHICMDLLHKPCGYVISQSRLRSFTLTLRFYAMYVRLSPCGHVLCQGCLQEWFRSAPAADDEMDDEGMPESLLYRKKTCPVCRTTVLTRPLPLFLVKSISVALEKVKGPVPRAPSPTPETDADPWAGIFFERSKGFDDTDEDDDSDDDDDEDEDIYEDPWSDDGDGYGTAEEGDNYEGPYVRPQWSPPSVYVSADDIAEFVTEPTNIELAMLRRGVTVQMMQLFHMSYSHEHGLTALIDGDNVVHLGWNIELLPGDESGEDFMEWVTSDIHERPERWDREDEWNGRWRAWKLIAADEVDEYATSDSEAWVADMYDTDDELNLL